MELPFEDNSASTFVTIGFGLRNVPDLVQDYLAEMKRVVKPGGKIVCLELSKPTVAAFKGIYYLLLSRNFCRLWANGS